MAIGLFPVTRLSNSGTIELPELSMPLKWAATNPASFLSPFRLTVSLSDRMHTLVSCPAYFTTPAGPIVPLADITITPLILHLTYPLVMPCEFVMPIRIVLYGPLLTSGMRPQVVVRNIILGWQAWKVKLRCVPSCMLLTTGMKLSSGKCLLNLRCRPRTGALVPLHTTSPSTLNFVSRWYTLELTELVVLAITMAPLRKPPSTLSLETLTLLCFRRLLTSTLCMPRSTISLLIILLTDGATSIPNLPPT